MSGISRVFTEKLAISPEMVLPQTCEIKRLSFFMIFLVSQARVRAAAETRDKT
jgi:hypothetical protein